MRSLVAATLALAALCALVCLSPTSASASAISEPVDSYDGLEERLRRDGFDFSDLQTLSQLLKPECTADALGYFVRCGTPLIQGFTPLISRITEHLPEGCEGIDCYTSINFDNVLADIERSTQDLQAIYDTMCVADGADKNCWDDLLELLPRCVRSSIQEELGGTYLTFDNFVNVAELLCLENHNNESCGVLMLEFSLLNEDLIDQSGHEACETTSCEPACTEVLTGIQDDLGCCYPELLTRLRMFDREFAIHDILEVTAEYWGVCELEEPVQACLDDSVIIEDTLTPGSLESGDGNNKTLSRPIIVAIVVGCIACIALIVATTYFATKHFTRPHQTYAFHNMGFVDVEEPGQDAAEGDDGVHVNKMFNPATFEPQPHPDYHVGARQQAQGGATSSTLDDALYDDDVLDT